VILEAQHFEKKITRNTLISSVRFFVVFVFFVVEQIISFESCREIIILDDTRTTWLLAKDPKPLLFYF